MAIFNIDMPPDIEAFYEWLKVRRGFTQAFIELTYLIGGVAGLFASDEEIIARIQGSDIYREWVEFGSPTAEEWKTTQASEQDTQEAVDFYNKNKYLPADQYDDPSSLIPPKEGMEWVKTNYAPDGSYVEGGAWYQSPIAETPSLGIQYVPPGAVEALPRGLWQTPDGKWVDEAGFEIDEKTALAGLDYYFSVLKPQELQAPSALEEAQTAYYQAQTENLSKQWTELTAAEKERFYNDQQYFEFQKQQWAEQFGLEKEKFGFEQYQFGNLSAYEQAQLEQQQFEFGNLSAYQQAHLQLLMKPWEQMTFYEQSMFDFSKEQFEWEKQKWQEDLAQQQYEFGNLSAWQQAQMGLSQQQFSELSAWEQAQMGMSQQELALQEKVYGAQLQQKPMDWLSAWWYANAAPVGQPNPAAPNQPYIPYKQIGVV